MMEKYRGKTWEKISSCIYNLDDNNNAFIATDGDETLTCLNSSVSEAELGIRVFAAY